MAKYKPLKQELLEEPFRFEFFQAVRILEKMYPDKNAVGREAMPNEEIVQFRSRIALDFPASQIHEFQTYFDEHAEEERLEMLVNFMGMVGMNGVLPIHYTEMILDRIRRRDTAMWAFMDIFTHRSVSMFFRAWEKYRFPVSYERGEDDFTDYLFDFAGLGTKGLRKRMDLEDESLLPYGGLISQKPHSALSLAQIVSDYFGINAKSRQFFGQWLELDKESITKLSQANSGLGVDAIIGTRVWDQQSKFRLVLGPMPFKKFRAFLPNGSAHKPLASIVRFMIGLEFDFDIQIKLEARQLPSCILTTRAKRRPMLGWTSWLKSKPFEKDDEQVVLELS